MDTARVSIRRALCGESWKRQHSRSGTPTAPPPNAGDAESQRRMSSGVSPLTLGPGYWEALFALTCLSVCLSPTSVSFISVLLHLSLKQSTDNSLHSVSFTFPLLSLIISSEGELEGGHLSLRWWRVRGALWK